MIRAVVFDLDGTLVQSEKLKAQSYAIAVQRLRGLSEPDPAAIEAYREIVGASREVASRHITERMHLGEELRPLSTAYGVAEAWEVLTVMRKQIYDDMVADPGVLRENRWPHTVELLKVARGAQCRTALATMSYRKEALHAIEALGLGPSLDLVLSREDVRNPKPDPEIYAMAAAKLDVPPHEFIALEDSPNGVRAAVAAGMNVIAIATPFTEAGLHGSQVLEHAWIVHQPEDLPGIVQERIDVHSRTLHQ